MSPSAGAISGRRGTGRGAWAAALFFAVAAVVMTWPLAADLHRNVSDPGDPYLTAWILRWDWTQLVRDPLHLFDANIFYPERLTLAFSENLFGPAVFGFPLDAAGLPPVFVYNVLFLLGMAASGFGAWALAREMTGDGAAAVVAGIFYAFVPFRFSQLPHFQMQWGPFLPLFLLFLWRFLRDGRRRDLVLYAVFFAWNAIACVHYGVFGGLALGLTAALDFARRHAWRGRSARRLGVATGLALLAVLPFALPYVVASRRYHFRRGLGELWHYSAAPKAFLSAGFRSKVYAAATARFAAPEADLFFGLLIPILAIVGYAAARRGPRAAETRSDHAVPRGIVFLDATIVFLGAVILLVLVRGGFHVGALRVHETYRLSMALFVAVVARLAWRFPRGWRHRDLGDWYGARRSPPEVGWCIAMIAAGIIIALGARFFLYRELYEIARPILGAIRAPTRGIVLAHLGLGVLAASGVAFLRRRAGRVAGAALPALAAAALLGELRAAPLSLFDGDPSPPPAIAWTDAHTRGAVVEVPMRYDDNFAYVLWAASHRFPIVNGYSGFFPKSFEAVQKAFTSDPVDPAVMARLSGEGVAAVLYHRGLAGVGEQRPISDFLAREVAAGRLVPVRAMGEGAADTVICAFPAEAAFFPATASDRAAALDALTRPLSAPTRPEGWYFEPQNGAVFEGGTIRGSGWAAAAEGMDRIAVVLDGRDVGTATYGVRHPEVRIVKPDVPCGDFCGYAFRIDGVPRGRHRLQARYVGKNGGVGAAPEVEIRMR